MSKPNQQDTTVVDESIAEAPDAPEGSDGPEGSETPDALVESDEDRQRREEEFAAEHDPEQHDIAAGEEFRQRGDWTADEAGGPQIQDHEGHVVLPDGPGGVSPNRADEAESALDQVRDGGYGVGSAAPIDGGVTPLGHPVKAWHDTATHVLPGQEGYDGAEPDVWFTDAQTAQAAGFRPAP